MRQQQVTINELSSPARADSSLEFVFLLFFIFHWMICKLPIVFRQYKLFSFSLPLSYRKKEVKQRLFCDICDEFDLWVAFDFVVETRSMPIVITVQRDYAFRHDTDDCPKQCSEFEPPPQEKKKTRPPPREYCDHCEGAICLNLFARALSFYCLSYLFQLLFLLAKSNDPVQILQRWI